MTWLFLAQCDACGALSDIGPTRSGMARILKREGWTKGGRPLQIFCPECREAGEESRARRAKKQGSAS